VHAGGSNGVHGQDALRQLAFQAAPEAHVLDELRHAQRIVAVHQFQAGRQLGGHALGGQQHAHLAQACRRHHHLAALRVDAVGDLFGLEHGHHVAGRDFLARAEHRLVAGLVLPQVHHDGGGERHGQAEQQRQVIAHGRRQRGQGQLAADGGFEGGDHG